ncbi:hypothetical protein [Natronospora cellulosivora (SeqCode)]
MKTFIKKISEIQTSQLYINKEKLSEVEKYISSVDIDNIDPLPIKKIGENIFFTDGHTRAFALYKRGEKEIKVYWDEDELNWIEYFVCINWCDKDGIKQIKDLEDRITSDLDYRKLWIDKCKSMHDNVRSNSGSYINIKNVVDPNDKSDICESVLRYLPEWFGIAEAINEYIAGVKDHVFLAVYVGKIAVGFLAIKEHNKFTSEIYVLGILVEFHKQGLGRKLIEKDEPTAALSAKAESELYSRFDRLTKKDTTLLISHRLGSTKLADIILVLDKGSLIEFGSHNELMDIQGLYAAMFKKQSGWYNEG